MTSEHPHVAVARQLIEAVEAGDLDALRELYLEDAVLWQNLSGQPVGREQAVKTVRWLRGALQQLRYEDVRVAPTPDGFVQQQTMVAVTADGQPLRVDACLVATLRDGRIARIDEYLDSGQLAPLRAGRGS